MTKNLAKHSRPRRLAAPYTKQGKQPYKYPWEDRLARGELRRKANDRVTNKYP